MKMTLKISSSQYLRLMGIFTPILLAVHFSAPSYAQINVLKGVPSFTNYVVGGRHIARQQVWTVNQNKDGFLFVGTSTGLQKFDGKNWELLASPTTEFNTTVRSTLLSSDDTFYYSSLGDFGIIIFDSEAGPLKAHF